MIHEILNLLKPFLEIAILWFAFYRILVFFEGSRAFQVLKGIAYLLVAFLLSNILELNTITWLLTKLFGLSIIAILIIFQQELRQGLARLGQQHLFSIALAESEVAAIIEQIASLTYKLANKKIGCLIAIERKTPLNLYIESGILIDSKVTEELLQSIFDPTSPIHDGGVIIKGERIASAACLFPLSENPSVSKTTGTRHRAALGLSEQTDSVVIMVSEENAEALIVVDGKFIPVSGRKQFAAALKSFLIPEKTKRRKTDAKLADK